MYIIRVVSAVVVLFAKCTTFMNTFDTRRRVRRLRQLKVEKKDG